MFESFMEIDDHVDARLDRDSEERDVAACHSNAEGGSVSRWGRLIFHVTDVDAFWTHLKGEALLVMAALSVPASRTVGVSEKASSNELSFPHPAGNTSSL